MIRRHLKILHFFRNLSILLTPAWILFSRNLAAPKCVAVAVKRPTTSPSTWKIFTVRRFRRQKAQFTLLYNGKHLVSFVFMILLIVKRPSPHYYVLKNLHFYFAKKRSNVFRPHHRFHLVFAQKTLQLSIVYQHRF